MTSVREGARDLWRALQLGGDTSDSDVPTIPFDLNIGHGAVRLARADDGNPRILIPCEDFRRRVESLGSFGIEVKKTHLLVSGRRVAFIEVYCRSTELQEVFLSLTDDVLRRLANGAGAERAISQAITEYRDLLKRGADLPLEFLVGVFGELALLERLQDYDADAAKAWTGPLKQRFDFSGTVACAEVKSTLGRNAEIVHISSLDQLDLPLGGRALYLVVQGLERSGAGGRSVVDLIESVRRRAGDPDVIDRALAGLDLDGWRESEALAVERFDVYRQRIFEVRSGFPRLGPDAFKLGNPPPGVGGIEYEVDLQYAEAFRVVDTETPATLSALAKTR
jgi:hypothetical protein